MPLIVRRDFVAVYKITPQGLGYKFRPIKGVLPGEEIIRCSLEHCDRPARQLDHLFPYHQALNRCTQHKGQ